MFATLDLPSLNYCLRPFAKGRRMTDTVVMNWHLSLLHYETNLIPLKFHCHGFLFRIHMCFCCSPRCLISCPSLLPLLLTSHLRSVYIYISKLSFLIELSQPRLCAICTLNKTLLFCYSVLSLRGYLLKKIPTKFLVVRVIEAILWFCWVIKNWSHFVIKR